MPIIPDNDPSEAYDVRLMPEHPRGPRGGWWTVTRKGIPVRHFGPDNSAGTKRYCCNPEYRLSRQHKYIHD
jgi:hypothetical protein